MTDQPTNDHPAKQILQSAFVGSLGTLSSGGSPFVTLVTVASSSPTQLVMLLSGLAKHTENLNSNKQCSLLLVQPGGENGNPLEGARLSVVGDVVRLPRDADAKEREKFLETHPEAAMYADFGDFSIYRMDIREAHLVAGFGRIETLTADQLSA
ncbi:HugZ family protein [Planctomycetes bacterium K23_9]|uniref:Pyridoxamine 5'-phosphate oxidase n=1 Tax=Stieleria marina TaxID=1930275 RepID=A0A517NMJ7_9BACT|nr:Pyridoxamine 5'-phosphate oxidase [Planctomycetes bacterium K23_9]